jgi:hypothetical protein
VTVLDRRGPGPFALTSPSGVTRFHAAFFHKFQMLSTSVVVLVSIEGSAVEEVGTRGAGDNKVRGGRKKSLSSSASGFRCHGGRSQGGEDGISNCRVFARQGL